MLIPVQIIIFVFVRNYVITANKKICVPKVKHFLKRIFIRFIFLINLISSLPRAAYLYAVRLYLISLAFITPLAFESFSITSAGIGSSVLIIVYAMSPFDAFIMSEMFTVITSVYFAIAFGIFL